MNVEFNSWTGERVEILKGLWAGGESCAKIAERINAVSVFAGPISRNAVIGKARRLGLEKRRIGVNPLQEAIRLAKAANTPPRKRRVFKVKTPRFALAPMSIAPFDVVALPEQAPAPDDTSIPLEQRCTVAELTADNCHWPIGDPCKPDFFFCGGVALEGLPYCACHARIAYMPMRAHQRAAPDRLGAFYGSR